MNPDEPVTSIFIINILITTPRSQTYRLFLLPFFHPLLYIFQRSHVRIVFAELQECSPSQLAVNGQYIGAYQIGGFARLNRFLSPGPQ